MCARHLTVILAAGDFPTAPSPLALLDAADELVCCDGAADALLRYGREPDFVVGDLDSLSERTRERLSGRLVRVEEQETNDLAKAFRFCRSRGRGRIVILGATGKREDHTLGNLAHLVDFAEEIPGIEIATDHGVFSVALRSGEFRSFPGERLSFFAVDPETTVTSAGLKYPMRELRLRRWWQATLNEALADTFSLNFTPGSRLLIYRVFRGEAEETCAARG